MYLKKRRFVGYLCNKKGHPWVVISVVKKKQFWEVISVVKKRQFWCGYKCG